MVVSGPNGGIHCIHILIPDVSMQKAGLESTYSCIWLICNKNTLGIEEPVITVYTCSQSVVRLLVLEMERGCHDSQEDNHLVYQQFCESGDQFCCTYYQAYLADRLARRYCVVASHGSYSKLSWPPFRTLAYLQIFSKNCHHG